MVTATTGTAQRPPQAELIQQATLDNGLQVIVVENHAVPLATVLLAVRGGAMMQEPGDQGLAHLFEHLLFRSFDGDPSAFAQQASSLDAYYNGTTGEEVVAYYLMLPSKNALKGIALLARLLQKARFTTRDLKDERPVVLDELQRAASDPEQVLERQASQLLWGPSWPRKDIGGDSATLQHIGLGRLRDAYARYYVPNNAALVVTGDVTADDVVAAARQRFGMWPRAPDPFVDHPVPPVVAMTASTAGLVAWPAPSARIVIDMRGPPLPRDSSAADAAEALCDVLNQGGSAFQRRLVENGLFQSVRCSYGSLAHMGPLAFRAETMPAEAPAALAALLGELDRLDHLEWVSEEDLTIGRQRRRVNAALALESSASLAPTLAFRWAGSGIDDYQRHDDRLNAQTVDDLRRFAQAYIVNRPRVIAVLAAAGVVKRLQALLAHASGGPGTPP
jgi:zinc protease